MQLGLKKKLKNIKKIDVLDEIKIRNLKGGMKKSLGSDLGNVKA